MKDNLEKLKYPIGQFQFQGSPGRETVEEWIQEIGELPQNLRNAVDELSEEQLDTQYRPQGWTVRQVVHHIGDSHLNSYIRFKWALTEERPVIKAYYEDRWAELPDYTFLSIADSLDFIEILHRKWVILLRALSEKQLEREFIHPDTGEAITLRRNIGIYAWHGRHHVAHITCLREKKNL